MASVPDEVEAVCRPESLRRDDILAPVRRFAALGIAGVVSRPAENGKAQRAHFVAVNFVLTPSPAPQAAREEEVNMSNKKYRRDCQ